MVNNYKIEPRYYDMKERKFKNKTKNMLKMERLANSIETKLLKKYSLDTFSNDSIDAEICKLLCVGDGFENRNNIYILIDVYIDDAIAPCVVKLKEEEINKMSMRELHKKIADHIYYIDTLIFMHKNKLYNKFYEEVTE